MSQVDCCSYLDSTLFEQLILVLHVEKGLLNLVVFTAK